MLKVNEVKIGTDVYKINYDGEMTIDNAVGQISPATSEIRLRKIAPNNQPIPDKQLYKTLLHEIIHAIDFVVFWNLEEKQSESESGIELFAEFIVDNIENFVMKEITFDEFCQFCEMTELNIKRHFMFFNMILRVIEENQELFVEYVEIFG